MIEVGEFIRQLQAAAEAARTKAEVTDEQIRRKAISMARSGYRFTPETFALVRPLLGGEGLLLSGSVGVGKSFFFYCAGIPALNLKVAQGKTLEQISKALDEHADEAILVDDVGAEESAFKSFGTSVRLLDYILERRSDAAAATHFTSNLDGDARLARYGERIDDRLFGFAREHVIGGESRRDPGGVRRKDAWFADFYLPKLWEICASHCGWYDRDERRCTKGKTRIPSVRRRPGYEPEPICPYCG